MLADFGSEDLLLYMPDVMRLFLALWLFAVGACVGSFLNVVVLRLPAGVGIARTSSRCPVCLHPIRWFDNIPIISWLVLRGRCRDCGTPISIRYPLVELLVALLVVTLGLIEIGLLEGVRGGENLPRPRGADENPRYWPFEYWSIYTYHVLVLVTLTGAALIEGDRHRVPTRLFLPAWVAGVAGSMWLPLLHPVAAWGTISLPGPLGGLVDAVCGMLVGAVVGAAAWPAAVQPRRGPEGGRTALLAASLAGLCVGWQLVGPVVATTSLLALLACAAGRASGKWGLGPWSAYLVPSLLGALLGWRWLVDLLPWLTGFAQWWLVFGWLAWTLVLSLAAARLAPAPRHDESVPNVQSEGISMDSSVDRDANLKAILDSPSYLPVEYDAEFLQQGETRPVRVQLELLKPEIGLTRHGVNSTIVVFGGTQVVESSEVESRLRAAREALAQSPEDPYLQRRVQRLERIAAKSPYYDAAREFARLVSASCQVNGPYDYVIVTGGGPGIMEAANRGAYDARAKSIGLNVTLPAEQVPNPYITPELCFQFHYFALRKMHFLLRAKAMVVFPGGFGTLDELFDALTLRQTERMQEIPLILFGRAFWQKVIDFQFLADEGVIADQDLDLISYAETPQEAWDIIRHFHEQAGELER